MTFMRWLRDEIEAMPDFYVVGEPDMSLIAYASDTVDMVAVGDGMAARGWRVYLERVPPSIHLMLSPGHEPFLSGYLNDLREVTELVKSGEILRKTEELKYGQ